MVARALIRSSFIYRDIPWSRGLVFITTASAGAVALLHNGNVTFGDEAKYKKNNNRTAYVKCDYSEYSPPPYPRLDRKTESPVLPTSSLLHRFTKDHDEKNKHLPMNKKYIIEWSNVLGEGAYGKVYLARVTDTGEKVAMKKISKRYTNSSAFTSEIAALWRIYEAGGHPNISGLRDIYEDQNHFYLVLDLARGGELFDHLIKDGSYSEHDASRLISEILSALAFLHNIGIVHSDIKPENVLLCDVRRGVETVKLIDFGCAKVDKRGESPFQSNQVNNSTGSLVGTRAYWAPECFGWRGKKNDSMDIWAVGCILFIMLCGVHPFDLKGIKTDKEIEERIKRNPHAPIHLATHLSPSARDFLKQLMNPDPNERLTAITALQHPWIRGVTTKSSVIDGASTKLEMYQDLKNSLRTGIFAALVDSNKLKEKKESDSSSLTHLLKRAFDVFDNTGKGFVTDADIDRVMTKVTGSELSIEDEKDVLAAIKRSSSDKSSNGLSLSDFSQMFSRLSHEHYMQGDYLYHPGDYGDAIFFINSGKIEILTKKGHLLSILRHGEFFGEGAIIEDRTTRIAAARCATPVDVLKVSREDFHKYISSSPETKLSIKHKWKARALKQAKKLIRIQTNLTRKYLKAGDAVFREGDFGESMYVVDEVEGGTLEVRLGDHVLHRLKAGDSFGESSLLFQRPRSSTIVCTSAECHLHEMKSSDFYDLLKTDEGTARALKELCRTRMFQRATKSYLINQSNSLRNDDWVKAFQDADTDNSGSLSLEEVHNIFRTIGNFDIPEEEVIEYFHSLELDDNGQVTLEEFKRVFSVIQ